MVEKTLDRRWMLRGAGAAGAAVVGGIALAGAAPADERRNSLEGSWLIEHQDDPAAQNTPVRAVASFAAGGVYTGFDIAPPSPPQGGTWARTGDGTFHATFWTGSGGDGSSEPAVVVRVRPRGRVRGNRISGTYRVQVSDAATGTVLQNGTGRFWGTRIEA